jgi:tyrosine-protein phosphatase SIW14
MRRRRAARFLIAALVALVAACATRPTTPTTHTWPQPCDDCIAGVPNFSEVTEKLWRGAQPDPKDADVFRRLAARGVKTVINLRHDHDDFAALQGTGIAYAWIPMRAWHAQEQDLVLFLATLRRALADPQRWPVYVHCAAGKDRTGYAIATYRIIEQGWDAESAIEEMFDFRYNPVWFGNPAFLRRIAERRADIAARVARTP